MIVSIGKDALQAVLSAPSRIASKASVDYMSCALIDARSESISIEASDRVESVRCIENALIEERGRALLPAKMLSGIVKTLPDGVVTISVPDGANKASVTCGKASFDIPSLSPSDFPAFPHVDEDGSIEVPAAGLSRAVKAASSFAAKGDKVREFMRGIQVMSDGSKLTLVSTDSYRVARIRVDSETDAFDALFPASFLSNALSGKHGDTVKLFSTDNQVCADLGCSVHISRAIDGNMPNVDAFFSGETNARACIDVSALRGAVKRACAVGGPGDPIKISISDSGMTISHSGTDEGSMYEELEADCHGMCTACINPVFLLDAVTSIDGNEAEIRIENPLKPIILAGGSLEAAIMPVRR